MQCIHTADLPVTAAEDREFLRTFMHAAFKDLMTVRCSETRAVLYREFDLILETWTKCGYRMDT